MKLTNKVELKIENQDKCFVILDSDCSLGQLFDFSCAFKAFIAQRIQEEDAKDKSEKKD